MSQDIIERMNQIRESIFRLQENVEGVLQRNADSGRYEDFVRSATDWVWEVDAKLNFTYVSEGATRVFSTPAPMLVGSYLFSLNRFREVGDTLLDLVGVIEERRPFRSVALRVSAGDGIERSILLSGVPVFDEDDGRFAGYRGTGIDATRRRPPAGAAWRDAEAGAAGGPAEDEVADAAPARGDAGAGESDPYHLAVDAGRVGVWDWDIANDRFRLAPGLKAMLGYDDDEIRGDIEGWYGCIHPDDRERVKGEVNRHLVGVSPLFEAEHRMAGGNGATRWFLSRGAAVRDVDGKAVRLAGICTEITGRVRSEDALRAARARAEAASRAKTAFLAHLSHELRTPLNAIIGFSEAIKDNVFGPLSAEKSTEYAADIYEASTHLLQLIDDILDLSRIEAGEMKLDESPVDLGAVVNAALRMVDGRARDRGLSLNVSLGADLPSVQADERAVKQIALNLLTNAIKFTPSGGVVSLRTIRRGDGGLRLEVSDTGIGIADEDIPKVLAPFGRADGDLAVKPEGVGLGLPLSKSLIELHGGTLELHSAKGCGTDVVVDFPASRTIAG